MTTAAPLLPTRTRRWLALLLAGLVFGMAVAGAAHAAEYDAHAAGETCEICTLSSGDGGALPATAAQPQFDPCLPLVAASIGFERRLRHHGDAAPRAPPA